MYGIVYFEKVIPSASWGTQSEILRIYSYGKDQRCLLL